MSEKKPGHAPLEDFVLAVRATRAAWDAFMSYQSDIAKAKIDMRIMSPKTTALLLIADSEYLKLQRVLSIAEAEIRKNEGEKH